MYTHAYDKNGGTS